MRTKITETIPIQAAMDNLAAIAGMNLESPPPLGILPGGRIVTNQEALEPAEVRWISGEGAEVLLQVLDETYRAVLVHLVHLYESKGMDFESQKSADGVAAIMSLVGESAAKMDLYLAFRFDVEPEETVQERSSFQKLQQFYSEKFAKKFKSGIEGEKAWNEEIARTAQPNVKSLSFEEVLKDQEYELFHILDESGNPYLDPALLRNVQLTVEFDLHSQVSFEDDPFLRARAMSDRDLQASALQILTLCSEEIHLFYEKRRRFSPFPISNALNKAVMALLLAANPKHLLQRTTKKHSSKYFADFQRFLREALKSSDYQKWLAYPPESSEKEARFLVEFVWMLCFSLVYRMGGVRQEAIGLIHRAMRKGEEIQPKEQIHRGQTVWENLLCEDERLRVLLRQFPKGPLLKIMDVIRLSREEGVSVPFDPWIQENIPSHLYTIAHKKHLVQVLRLPAPIRQKIMNKVEIIDEFRGFLLALKERKEKHLLVQVEDRLSWKEGARSLALEELSTNKVFSGQLIVLTLPKDTEFYHQSGKYLEMHKASQFLTAFKNQFIKAKENGFYFPPQWKEKDLHAWIDAAISWIYKVVFAEKTLLVRREREDFIEIFYQILIAQAITYFGVDSLSFTCKDAIDTGASASALFYGCIALTQEGTLSKEQLDTIRYLLYWPALNIRERGVNPELVVRTVAALETMSRSLDVEGCKIFQSVFENWKIA